MSDFPGKTALYGALAVLGSASTAMSEDVPVRVVLFGDSYISSYGVDSAKKYEVQLQAALDAAGRSAQVVGTGYTSTAYQGTRALTGFLEDDNVLGGTGPKAVILELGSNDCFRYTLAQTTDNLDTILKELSDRNIPTLVAGTLPYATCERKDRPNYTALYVQMFADLAAKHGDLYYRDFKDGVGDNPDLLQTDHDHPTADGEAVIVARMLPVVVELIERANPH